MTKVPTESTCRFVFSARKGAFDPAEIQAEHANLRVFFFYFSCLTCPILQKLKIPLMYFNLKFENESFNDNCCRLLLG